MSVLARIFAGYRKSLDESYRQFDSLYHERLESGCQFYRDFFKDLIIQYKPLFESERERRHLREFAEQIFGTDTIHFVAIDGTCFKDAFREFVVFFGGAYGARGSVHLQSDPPRVKYERWGLERDVSLVAYVPVPFATLEDVYQADRQEAFVVSDTHRINLSNIQTSLMQLAEVYLAYMTASATTHDYPRLILMDMSLSGLMAAISHGANTALAGYPYDRRALDDFDIQVAFIHPINEQLALPSTKRFMRHYAVLAQFHLKNTTRLSLDELSRALNLSNQELQATIRYLTERQGSPQGDRRPRQPPCQIQNHELITHSDVRQSWEYTVSLFTHICKRLFEEKDPTALVYEAPDVNEPQRIRRRWMSPDDVHFLTAVGLRALIEKCWERKILLIGIAKDSESAYLTRNYLGVMKQMGVYPQLQSLQVGLLPWTDRLYLESISQSCDETLEAPWSTIEFDSVFMTLRLGREESDSQPVIMGTPTRAGEIVSPERLFLRSLAQFFLSRAKRRPLCGHVVFIDRLALPDYDRSAFQHSFIAEGPRTGKIIPLLYPTNAIENRIQRLMMYLLDVLTRNHYAEVIGYPDPLHKADWGAKTIGRKVRKMLESSEIPFRAQPLTRTLRDLRDERTR